MRYVDRITCLPKSERRSLDEQGYLALPGLMPPEFLAALRRRIDELFEEEGDHAGSEFKQEPGARRLANLVNKGAIFEEVILHAAGAGVRGARAGPRFKLSSLNARSTNPHSDADQPLHADSGAIADERGYWVCNSVWMLDDFTPENGATRMVPARTAGERLPRAGVLRAASRRATGARQGGRRGGDERAHVARRHRQSHGCPRRAMHVYYTRWDKPQQQYQKRLLRRRSAGRGSRRKRVACWRWTIR